jgi:hypothetical protein
VSSRKSTAAADDVGVIKLVLGPGLRRIEADAGRLGSALRTVKPESDRFPVAVADAVDAASADVRLLQRELGLLKLIRHPALTHAKAGLASLALGLSEFRRSLLSIGPPKSRAAQTAFARASAELLAADRALGCPFGCPQPAVPTRRP